MTEFRCEKHGVIPGSERIVWSKNFPGKRWCIHCVNEMMDKFCGKLIEVEVEDEKK